MYAFTWNVYYCNFDYASREIVFILLKEHYIDLGLHPQIDCIGMVSSRESLQAIWEDSSLLLTSWCMLIWAGRDLGPGRPFAAEVVCGQVIVSHLTWPWVAVILDCILTLAKESMYVPFAGRVFVLLELTDWYHLKLGHFEWRSTQKNSVRVVQYTTNLFIQPIQFI